MFDVIYLTLRWIPEHPIILEGCFILHEIMNPGQISVNFLSISFRYSHFHSRIVLDW